MFQLFKNIKSFISYFFCNYLPFLDSTVLLKYLLLVIHYSFSRFYKNNSSSFCECAYAFEAIKKRHFTEISKSLSCKIFLTRRCLKIESFTL